MPVSIDGPVSHCGWHSRKSFGAISYLRARPPERGSSAPVDSPSASAPLVGRRFEWVLPGHGMRARMAPERCEAEVGRLLVWSRRD